MRGPGFGHGQWRGVKEGHVVPNYAFALYGKLWIDRFDGRRMYCPDYQRFLVDREWWVMANEVKRWTYCHNAMIYSLPEDNDKTHNFGGRDEIMRKDSETFERRRREGLIWGING